MPPENTNPVAKSETSEFEFNAPPPPSQRIRKRNLKARPVATGATSPTPAERPTAPAQPAVYAQPAAVTHSAPTEPRPTYVRPSTTAERPQPAPASGVLYYSSNHGTKKDDSMKFNSHPQATRPTTTASQPISQRPAAVASSTATASSYRPASATHSTVSNPTPHSSSSSTSTPASSAARAVSTTVSGPSSSSRPAGVSDFRGNIDRQSREQKSIGSVLNVIVYVLIGLFVFAGLLAGYGAHDVYKQLRKQSTTVSELDARYSAANQELSDKLTTTQQGVQQLQAQLSRAQELLLRQQEILTKLQTSLDAQSQALREERATRAAETSIREQETASLRSRLRTLEARIDNPNRL